MSDKLYDGLFATLRENVPALPDDAHRGTSLIQSGILDSAGLFHVALWVEREIGDGFDFTAFDLAAEWDTMEQIVTFVQKHRKRKG